MYASACAQLSHTIFGLSGYNRDKSKIYRGTAFAIRPTILITAAHNLHTEGNFKMPILEQIQAHGASDSVIYGVALTDENPELDIAILKLQTKNGQEGRSFPTMTHSVILGEELRPIGSDCGVLGFACSIAHEDYQTKEIQYRFIERFQGGHISASHGWQSSGGQWSTIYELDTAPCPGSSGSPVFLSNGHVIGMLTEVKHSPIVHARGLSRGILDELSMTPFSACISSKDIRSFALAKGIELE